MRKIFLLLGLCFALLSSAYAQQKVTGKVTDDDGLGIPGVSVIQKGTSIGTITSVDGDYTLNDVPNGTILVFSFVGMTTVEETVDGRPSINVELKTSAVGIDEVVVTALGIRRDSKALGYAISKVSSDRIMASGTPVNALQSLYGSAAGVQVASTASGPTGGMKINIRNAVSFDENSTTRPLIVVDGVPIHDENTSMSSSGWSTDNGTGINDINPDDIASFEILKGAKASVLYGSKGANGVVLITTKSGKKSKGLGISASVTTSWDKIAFTPDFQNTYGTGRSPSSTETDDQGFFLDDNDVRTLDYSGVAFGPKFDPNVKLQWWDGSERPWEAQSESIYDQMFRTGRQTTSNVALSSSSDNGSIRFSYTNMQITPTAPAGSFDKNTFSLNASYKLNDFISMRYIGNFYHSKNLNAVNTTSFKSQGSGSSIGAYSGDIDVDLLRNSMVTEDGYNFFADPAKRNFISPGRSAVVGFFWGQEQNLNEFTRTHNIQSVTFDVKINKTFNATMMGGMDMTTSRSIYQAKISDPTTGKNTYMDDTQDNRQTYGQGMINFDTDISDFNISGFVGGAIQHNYVDKKGASVKDGLVIPNWFSFNNVPSGYNPSYVFNNGEDILYSLLGSAQLEWKDQLYFEIQGRQDWSSILPVQNNSYFYPGASATWIMSNSLTLPTWIDFAKLRVSGADVGRPGPRYFSNVNYGVSESGAGYILSPPSHLPPMDENGVPNLEPERKREFEFGFEAYLFENQRIGIDFSYYNSNTYNQIMAVTAPPGMGVSKIRMNAGDIATQGWELGLKTKPIHTKDFKWNLDITFAASKTRVEKLDGNLSTLSLWGNAGLNTVAEVGGEYGLIYQQKGWQNYINPSDPNDPNNGKRIVKGNGSMYDYNTKSGKMVGKTLPDVIGGVFTGFNYKNFSLIANLDYSFGAFFISHSETYMMASGVLDETYKYRDEENGGIAYHLDGGQKVAGTAPGGGTTFFDGVMLDGVYADGTPNDKVVSADEYYSASYFANGFFPEDRLFKSDYIALRNVSIEYRFPVSISSRIGLNDLTMSVFANNVAYLYKDAPNSIPESSNGTSGSNSSVGNTSMPSQRSLGLALKIKL